MKTPAVHYQGTKKYEKERFSYRIDDRQHALLHPAIHAQSGGDTATAQDVKKETQELISTLGKYTAAQRDEAIKTVQQAMKKLDQRIDALESRIDNNWDNMNRAARQKARASLKALRKQRNELAEQYGSLKSSSASAWGHMKKGFSDAYQSVHDAWEKAEAEFDSDHE